MKFSFLTVFLAVLFNTLPLTNLTGLPHIVDLLEGDISVYKKGEHHLEIHASAGAMIIFDNFSLQEDENLDIHLPSPNDCVYVKVKSKTPTHIMGHINVNGAFYLMDHQGIHLESNAKIKAADISIKSKHISHQGIIHAEKANGSISTIVLTADLISLKQNSVINASGNIGGSHIYIGGGWKGSDNAIPNAQEVLIEENALILANALQTGNGGFIVIWSEKLTKFFGNLSAMGRGPEAQGGLAEIASKLTLEYDGNVILNADNGSLGTLLLE